MQVQAPLAQGMVCAPQPYAVDAAVDVLERGGNAMDAAITAGLIQGVVSPHMCGLGGYLVATIHQPGSSAPESVDGPAVAGSGTTPDMWADRFERFGPTGWGYILRDQVNDCGYTSICVPGSVKALDHMHRKWGSLPWADLFEPAADLAEGGWRMMDRTARVWQRWPEAPGGISPLEVVQRNPEASRIFLTETGKPPLVNQPVSNPDHGTSLRHVAKFGAEDFYRGEMKERMAADLEANGSFVTAGDLEAYALPPSVPVCGSFKGWDVSASAPPHGGATVVAILNIMERLCTEPGLEPDSPRYLYLLAMAMKAAFADRNPHMADPEFEAVPTDWMMDPARADHWVDIIQRGDPIKVSFQPQGSKDTTHVSVVDRQGLCVSLTHSLGSASGVVTPGMGFMYNNSMVNFHPLPGHPNSIAPGKGRTTGMSPTIVTRGGLPRLILGAPGSTMIITSVAQVLLNTLLWGMNVKEAVDAPRLDCQGDLIRMHARFPRQTVERVANMHPAERTGYSRGGFAIVHAIAIDEAGSVTGVADPGADGMAVAV